MFAAVYQTVVTSESPNSRCGFYDCTYQPVKIAPFRLLFPGVMGREFSEYACNLDLNLPYKESVGVN